MPTMTAEDPRRGTEQWWAARYAQPAYLPGALVLVTEQYRGSGRWAHDGNEGLYRVLRPCGPMDYYLVHEPRRARHDGSSWDLICHVSRMVPA